MENENITPPPVSADGTADVELLQAISRHPAAAQALAAIARGADPAEALAALLPPEQPAEAAGEEKHAAQQRPGIPVASPAFLANIAPDFWDGF